ncbi:MAG: cell division protein ZapA [Endomicrobium sp.]|jgi:cell division protein ZapA|nr:cell division protein ZapA [Endomicrobium sp.]
MNKIYERVMGRDIEFNVENIDRLSFDGVVNFVNEEWMEVKKENSSIPDTQKIAVLTAVKIAMKLFKLKDLQKNNVDNYEKKIDDLIKQLDDLYHIS